jgi:hypothetical protein
VRRPRAIGRQVRAHVLQLLLDLVGGGLGGEAIAVSAHDGTTP